MLNQEVVAELCTVLTEKFGLATTTQLDRAVADVLAKTDQRQRRSGGNMFSLSKMIRGLRAMKGEAITPQTADSDVNFVRTLTTGTTPGSYLVPTIQADEIIQFLETGGIARASGFRVWPMVGIQKMNVPVALGAPSWVWMAQGSAQMATDPNLGQMSFDLKERRALIAVPNQMLAVSVPAFDTLLGQLLGLSAAAHEDTAIFATSTISGAPTALLSASGITTLNVGGSANGGNLGFSDILAVLAKASAVKARPPFAWYVSPRTMYQRIMGLIDLQSRPIFIPTLTEGLQNTGILAGSVQRPVGNLMGYPVWCTPYIPENETNGSGSSQSHIIFQNPTYSHLAEDSAIEIAISLERYFDSAETAIRASSHMDAGVQPAAGLIALLGVN